MTTFTFAAEATFTKNNEIKSQNLWFVSHIDPLLPFFIHFSRAKPEFDKGNNIRDDAVRQRILTSTTILSHYMEE